MLDPHSVLGVPLTAGPADIKAAYRRLASQLHPDRNPGNASAEERLKEVILAYRFLSEQQRQRETARPVPQGNDFFTFIDRMTDLFRRAPEVRVPLTFREALAGVTKQVRLSRFVPCPVCEGQTPKHKGQCQACRGEGRTSVEDQVRFSFKAGSDSGERVQGTSALGAAFFGVAEVSPDALWERDGVDLSTQVFIPLAELKTGGKVSFATPYGRLEYTLPAGACLAEPLLLRGHGVACADGKRGDLWVSLAVELPTSSGKYERTEHRREQEAEWEPVLRR